MRNRFDTVFLSAFLAMGAALVVEFVAVLSRLGGAS
jgi:hypothetical protein